jgi:hypothetical protein
MTARDRFHACMAERRQWPRGSMDWQYLTRAARQYAWIVRRVPTTEWRM